MAPDHPAAPPSADTLSDASGESLAKLYREVILAHAARPVGYQAKIAATHTAEGSNPLCGDHVTLQLQVAEGQVQAAAFHGESCAICMASVSLLCEQLPGRSVAEIERLADGFQRAVANNDDQACPGFLKAMLGVRQYPARLQCALLPWQTAQDAISI